ncbi:uncharacterized protein IL334_005077 [Kwoniella shivajii]|uniref:Protein kinase domain-containing protein n=1 Tax=Kwoniella shivajii TaxID=564305 RepID=A0ABZ1D3C0_9TREE|nr:hypothetical protein IL334_005077 [Kwoniella shivajii]
MVQPTISKQKSKIRLRLGLTPPKPKTKQNQQQQQIKPQFQPQQYHSQNQPTHLSPNFSTAIHIHNTAKTIVENGLSSSTSTSVSGVSRADSRSAFTYDSFTPSPSPPNKDFDTISYNTISPESIAFTSRIHDENHPNQSYATLVTETSESQDDEEAIYQSFTNQYFNQDQDQDHAYNYDYDYQNHNDHRNQIPHNQEHAHYGERTEEQENTLLATNHFHLHHQHSHPNIYKIASGTDDIFSLTDQQLSNRFTFISEIGFGNWGSVWLCKPKNLKSASSFNENGVIVKLGKKAATSGGLGASGKVAVKLVHRSRTPATSARVRALWGEMKIFRSLRHEPHPSIIRFEAFVITPSYALVIMPHLARLIPVCLSPPTATPYFRQLASAVGYLHERGITHNDIKPANVLLSHNDIPVLVDFGFAQRWDVGVRGSFLSSISWGTPEYLDPIRAQGMPHDERASDIWSLGITMFEILMGRTPFETDEEEEFSTPEELLIYYERSKRGEWVGDWSMPEGLENLLRHMINPDPAYRISAMQAYHHPALQPSAPSVVVTPNFVKAATLEYSDYTEPVPAPPAEYMEAVEAAKAAAAIEKKKKRKTKKDQAQRHSHRAATPALGESIKQHTSVSKPKRTDQHAEDKENTDVVLEKSFSRLVIRKREEDIKDDEEDDPTPTKVLRPAQPLRIKELSLIADKKVVPRISNSHLTNLSRPSSATSQCTAHAVISHSSSSATIKDKRVSILSSTSTVPKSKEEAVLKTMRSLEGTRKLVHGHDKKDKACEALAAVKRQAPEPPRPKSLDSVVQLQSKKDDERRSLGIDRAVLVEVKEDEVDITVKEGGREVDTVVHFNERSKVDRSSVPAVPMSPPRAQRSSANRIPTPSPQKVRRTGRIPHAEMDTVRGKMFPASDDESPLAELREKIVTSDQESSTRYREVSGDLMETLKSSPSLKKRSDATPSEYSLKTEIRNSVDSTTSTSMSQGLSRARSVEALDKMSSWIRSVEGIIEDARKAIAEGREPPLPVLSLPKEIVDNTEVVTHTFGVTPEKNSIPAHLRTSSVQVEPATPPKWPVQMDLREAEEKVRLANKWLEDQGRKGKKDRPSVSQVLKLFGSDKERPLSGSRSNTPDPVHLVALKPPASASSQTLRGAPSTPALRSSSTRSHTKVPMRKSESNLRNFNTMPTIPSTSFTAGPEYDPLEDEEDSDKPRRVMFENMLSTQPGVIRQGDGWGSLSSGRGFMKPSSSMASLRERARAILGDNTKSNDPTKTHHRLEKRSSKLNINVSSDKELPSNRPGTPAAQSVLTMKTDGGHKKGWLKSLKGAMGMGKKMDKLEEGL